MHAFMYLPCTSAHRPTVFRAWIKAELTRYILLKSERNTPRRRLALSSRPDPPRNPTKRRTSQPKVASSPHPMYPSLKSG